MEMQGPLMDMPVASRSYLLPKLAAPTCTPVYVFSYSVMLDAPVERRTLHTLEPGWTPITAQSECCYTLWRPGHQERALYFSWLLLLGHVLGSPQSPRVRSLACALLCREGMGEVKDGERDAQGSQGFWPPAGVHGPHARHVHEAVNFALCPGPTQVRPADTEWSEIAHLSSCPLSSLEPGPDVHQQSIVCLKPYSILQWFMMQQEIKGTSASGSPRTWMAFQSSSK